MAAPAGCRTRPPPSLCRVPPHSEGEAPSRPCRAVPASAHPAAARPPRQPAPPAPPPAQAPLPRVARAPAA
eukprot:6156225-Prymnesium_polylepis.1